MAQLITSLATAVTQLRAGRAVAFPTETVYGLGARAADAAAVRRIFALKGRPPDHPLIIHIAAVTQLDQWASAVPALALALAERFWPGPLTLVLPRRAECATVAAGGRPTIALRIPAHPRAQQLLADLGEAVVAPSANRFGRPSPTQPAHVLAEFAAADISVLDGGPTEHGIESSVVDLCTPTQPQLLRPGVISQALLEEITGPLTVPTTSGGAPGTLAAHYAPRQPLQLLPAAQYHACRSNYAALGRQCPAQVSPAHWRQLPADPIVAAQQLFTLLRELESTATEFIAVECPPADPAWAAILDRLTRAAAASV